MSSYPTTIQQSKGMICNMLPMLSPQQNVTEHKELLMSLLLSWKNFRLLNMLMGVAMTFEGSELTLLHANTQSRG